LYCVVLHCACAVAFVAVSQAARLCAGLSAGTAATGPLSDVFAASGVVAALCKLLSDPNVSAAHASVHPSPLPPPPPLSVSNACVPILSPVRCAATIVQDVRREVLSALINLSEHEPFRKQMVAASAVPPLLMALRNAADPLHELVLMLLSNLTADPPTAATVMDEKGKTPVSTSTPASHSAAHWAGMIE
jgi:hypothetical protein